VLSHLLTCILLISFYTHLNLYKDKSFVLFSLLSGSEELRGYRNDSSRRVEREREEREREKREASTKRSKQNKQPIHDN